jgi:GH43 family beta-xylosidase
MKHNDGLSRNDLKNVFSNPILETGADPWMIQHGDHYYYCGSDNASSIFISVARDPTRIGEAEPILVWKAPEGQPYSHQTWAPELFFLDDRWYIYFAASDGCNTTHRMFVLEAEQACGPYRFKGQISPPTDTWAIDGTVIEHDDGERYFVWSGWDGAANIQQNLYIAKMLNPWTLACSGERLTAQRVPDSASLLTFDVSAEQKGDYVLEIAYEASSHAMLQLEINDSHHISLHFAVTGPHNVQTHFEKIQLNAGSNQLRFKSGIGDVSIKDVICKSPLADRRLLSTPEFAWEKMGGPCYVTEGPAALKRNGKLHIIYSASASWTDDYQLGRLTFMGGDILDSKNWKKHGPVFQKTETVFGPGHASFIEFEGQDWIVYHSAKYSGAGWNREVRMQPFSWSESDEPEFGRPATGVFAKSLDFEASATAKVTA